MISGQWWQWLARWRYDRGRAERRPDPGDQPMQAGSLSIWGRGSTISEFAPKGDGKTPDTAAVQPVTPVRRMRHGVGSLGVFVIGTIELKATLHCVASAGSAGEADVLSITRR
jgi:hypothetical protein